LRPLHYGQFEDCPFIIMPLCTAGSLEDAIVVGRDFSESELAVLFSHTAEGLTYIHGKGILHNDIKPGNILISNTGEFLLSDFGISSKTRFTVVRNSIERTKMAEAKKSTASALSIAYAATELFGENPINTAKSDIFSLGVTLYEVATGGNLPWMGEGGKALNNGGMIPNLPKEKYSKELNQILRRCLDPEPANRPLAKELSETAKHFLEQGVWKPLAGANPSPIPPLPPEKQKPDPLPPNNGGKKVDNGWNPKNWMYALAAILSIAGLFGLKSVFFNKPTDQNPAILPSAKVGNCKSPIWDEIQSNKQGLTIAKEGEAPPMFWCKDYNTASNCQGFEYELGQMLAGKLNLDKISTALDNMDWSDSYLDFGLCLIVKKGSTIKDISQLSKGKKVVVYEGDNKALEWVKANTNGLDIKEAKDPATESGIWMKGVENGSIDAAIYDYPFAARELKENYHSLQIVKLNLNSSSYSIGLPAGNLCFREKVNQALSEIKESPRYAELVRKYLKSDAIAVVSKFAANARLHVVKDGESLTSIARDVLGDMKRWEEIYELNKTRIPNPHLIFTGYNIVLPDK
jgi:serine/threonine protein kinase